MSFRKFINSIAEAEGHPRMATVAETTLRKILSNARIKPFQVSYYCERRDPEFDAKMHDVLVIYKQIEMQFDKDGKLIPCEKDAVHTLSYDEKPGIQQLPPRVKTVHRFRIQIKAVAVSEIMSMSDWEPSLCLQRLICSQEKQFH